MSNSLFLNPEQKALIKQWFGVSCFVYNTTIKYLQEPGTKASWLTIKTGILNSLPEWAKPVPFQIKSIAIKDACSTVKAAKQGFSKDGQIRKCKFRSREHTKQSIYVPNSAIKDCGVYHSLLGKCRFKEALPETFSDGRQTLAYGEYYLIVSEEVQQVKTDKQGRLVALDPGVRTFMTFFSEDSYGWLGNDYNLHIQKLCFRLDKLLSKISQAPSQQKIRFKKAASRLRCQIKNLVKEFHHKTAIAVIKRGEVCPMPYALCPMPYALCTSEHVTEKGYNQIQQQGEADRWDVGNRILKRSDAVAVADLQIRNMMKRCQPIK